MIWGQSQAEREFRERFYRCDLIEDLDPKEIKFWKMLIPENETVKESDLIDRILGLLKKEETPENNTRALNMIFDARNDGFIQDTGMPWSHVYRMNSAINKILFKEC